MWISLNFNDMPVKSVYPQAAVAVKVSVGGINAITGLSKHSSEVDTQDYLCHRQPWLDGIATEPGVVRQFTAVSIEDSYTIEEQLTGQVSMSMFNTVQYQSLPTIRDANATTIIPRPPKLPYNSTSFQLFSSTLIFPAQRTTIFLMETST